MAQFPLNKIVSQHIRLSMFSVEIILSGNKWQTVCNASH
jgi:hypothetical protein